MVKTSKKHLVDSLRKLEENYGVAALKLSTEDEGLTHYILKHIFSLFSKTIPIILKIGGPEARGDLSFAFNKGVKGFVAPMIESPFGLYKYVSMIESLGIPEDLIELSVNIETKTAVSVLRDMTAYPYFKKLSRLNIGRGDLSRSLGENNVDTPRVDRAVKKIIDVAQESFIPFSIGGGVLPQKIERIIEKFNPPYFNTRNILFLKKNVKDAKTSVQAALEWEINYLEYLKIIDKISYKIYDKRVKELIKRITLK